MYQLCNDVRFLTSKVDRYQKGMLEEALMIMTAGPVSHTNGLHEATRWV